MEANITQSNLKQVEGRRGFEFIINLNKEKIRAGGAMFNGSENVYLNDNFRYLLTVHFLWVES